MPCCSALNCSNSEKKARLFIFPKDEKRRNEWTNMCARPNWTPKRGSRLCEEHFAEDQFENRRADGWKKLKHNAIPTIFWNARNHALDNGDKENVFSENVSKENVENNNDDQTNINVHMESDNVDHEGTSEVIPIKKILKPTKKLQKKNRQFWNVEDEIRRLKKKNATLCEQMHNSPFLNDALKVVLMHRKKKVLEWSPEIIKMALQIRFAVGWKGYKYLRKEMVTQLPSYQTLCRHLQKINFNPGLLKDLLPYLQANNERRTARQNDCVLLMDEMDIHKALEYDRSNECCMSHVTTEEKSVTTGAQVLVFMLRGMNENWKQIIAWHVVGKKGNAVAIFNLVMEVLTELEKIGYRINAITSDIGPKNQAIWKKFGIRVGKKVLPRIIHPVRPNEYLYFFADVSHLLKNLRSALFKHDIILPDDLVDTNGLPTAVVSIQYLKELGSIQERDDLKLAPNVTAQFLEPSKYEKMKANIFSWETADALDSLVKLHYMHQDALTTVWFLKRVREWFDTLNGQIIEQSITKNNHSAKLTIMRRFIKLVQTMKIGNAWQPVQTGIILSTLNAIFLINELLFIRAYKYVLPSRWNQHAS